MSGVELRGLSKVFPNGIEAVSNVELNVEEGELLAVVGPSGSGKSTLLRLIAGLETPTAGVISIGGRDVSRVAPGDRDVSMVFQDPALFPYLSVTENLAFGLRARGVGRVLVRERVESVAGPFGLSGLLDRRPETLSGGQRQRVALGRALVRRPAVFLLDEPLSRLDAPLRASIRSDLSRQQRALNATMIHVTHDQAEALALGDRVAVMDRGRILQVGTPYQVYEHPATRFVAEFVGGPPMNLIRCSVLSGEGPNRISLGPSTSPILLPEGRWSGPLVARRGRGVDLGLRPEHVALARGAEVRNPAFCWASAPARVDGTDYLGHESLVALRLEGGRCVARVPGTVVFRAGEWCAIGFDLDRASWFEPETGAAIPPQGGFLLPDDLPRMTDD